MRSLLALLLLLSAGDALAGGSWLDGGPYGVHFRLGGLSIIPTARGGAVELANVSGPARLSGMSDGPIAGSSTRVGRALLPAAIVGYAPPILNRQLSVETVLALPVKQRLYAGGTLADRSLAPTALGTMPTGVPPLGSDLGEVTVLSPVLTAVYRFFPAGRLRPYLGAGGCLLVVLDTEITNPVLTGVRQPTVDTSPQVGWVVQAGTEIRFGGRFFLAADVKYVGGLAIRSRMKDISVSVPSMPLYGSTKMGDAVSRTRVDPVVPFLGVGMDL